MSQVSLQQQGLAFFSLTAVSACIGIAMKISQTKGKYTYSPLSVIAMTELFKLISSLIIIGGIVAKTAQEKSISFAKAGNDFWKENFSLPLLKHGVGLAFAYAIVNFVTFGIMLHASASTFFFLKAASPVITALILRAVVSRPISSIQWVAVVMQCVGLVVSQYDGCSKSGFVSLYGYILILINIIVSCIAGVWNENVIKSYNTSVNAQNAMLYSCGVLLNLFFYYTVPPSYIGMEENDGGLFAGYNMKVIFVIASNGCVGLVITAVYRYADVVVKTFGLAGSTTVLYLLEALKVIPSAKNASPVSTLAGFSVVFYSAYLYMAPPILKPVDPETAPVSSATPETKSPAATAPIPLKEDRRVGVVAVLALGALVILLAPSSCGVA